MPGGYCRKDTVTEKNTRLEKVADKLDLKVWETGGTPSEFKVWKETMLTYYNMSQLCKATTRHQQAFFKSWISTEINIKIYYTNTMTWADCINKVESLFNQEYPLQRKQLEFLGYKAQSDEQLSNTMAKMMELALYANVKDMTPEELIALKML